MKSVRIPAFCVAFLLFVSVRGRSQSVPARAFDNVTIHTAGGEIIESGTIVWRNGIIEAAGRNADIPFDAFVIDGGDSLHVYPGFIDGLALWGSPDLPEDYKEPDEPGNPGYVRAGIQPQRQPNNLLKTGDNNFTKAQKHGFTTAGLGLKGQMLPGQVDLFFINGKKTGDYLIKKGIGVSGSFEEAAGSAYPSTLMGVMARLRQLWYDAAALRRQEQYVASASSNYPVPPKDEVLEALFPVMDRQQPLFFSVDTKENIARLLWLKEELGFDVILVSGKEAWKQADQLKQQNIPVLASIDLPEEPEWRIGEGKDEEVTEEMRLFRERQLNAYEARIHNIKGLIEAGVKVGYASVGMKLSDFGKHIRTLAGEGGLSESQILALLTQHTADILGIGGKTGNLQQGKIASFTVFTRPFTEEKAQVVYSVSGGTLTEFEPESSKKEE